MDSTTRTGCRRPFGNRRRRLRRARAIRRRRQSACIKLPGPVLTIGVLKETLAATCDRIGAGVSEVVLDFTDVRELPSPWTIHWAMIAGLASRLSVRVRGLHGQPLRIAMLYKNSSAIHEILTSSDGG